MGGVSQVCNHDLEVKGPPCCHHHGVKVQAQTGGGAVARGPWHGLAGLGRTHDAHVWQSGARCRTSPRRGSGWSCEAWRSSPTTACRCWPTPRPGMACAAACSTSRPRRMVSAHLPPSLASALGAGSQGLLLQPSTAHPLTVKGESRAPSFLLSLSSL